MGRRTILGFLLGLWRGLKEAKLRTIREIPRATSGQAIPDLAASIFEPSDSDNLIVSCASYRGRGHEVSNTARQDSYSAFATNDFLVVAVADGVSSSSDSHLGAQLVTRELESVFMETISTSNVEKAAAWSALNQSLSKQLVRVHANRLRRLDKPVPESLNQLRESAADSLATTLEILVMDFKKNPDGTFNFHYINVAGDGSLYLIEGGRIVELNPDKPEVFALPASDKEPIVISGTISPNTSIALCTDGIGSNLLHDQFWRDRMLTFASIPSPSYSQLIDFITYRGAGALDDQTFILLGFK